MCEGTQPSLLQQWSGDPAALPFTANHLEYSPDREVTAGTIG